jgi:hypothetical protein
MVRVVRLVLSDARLVVVHRSVLHAKLAIFFKMVNVNKLVQQGKIDI